jgi:uncharacterized protein (TIGR00730 family)
LNSPPLAYLDPGFVTADEGRAVRLLSEYLHPMAALREKGIEDTVVFFGSSRIRESDPMGSYYEQARELAHRVTEWGRSIDPSGRRLVVCSGGGGGIMEAANRGASEAGGLTLGLNIGLPNEQRPNQYLDPQLTFEFHYFFMRKLWFAHLARALIVFPGGFGTLDELFEILTLRQTGKLSREICVILFGTEYWNRVVNFDVLREAGMIDDEHLLLLHRVDSVADAMRCLETHVRVVQPAQAPFIVD